MAFCIKPSGPHTNTWRETRLGMRLMCERDKRPCSPCHCGEGWVNA
ncbi:Uncharacterised protein [Vibrio cholerae]|nr:Uncharacterised protein [Vibrio cholerae]